MIIMAKIIAFKFTDDVCLTSSYYVNKRKNFSYIFHMYSIFVILEICSPNLKQVSGLE